MVIYPLTVLEARNLKSMCWQVTLALKDVGEGSLLVPSQVCPLACNCFTPNSTSFFTAILLCVSCVL